MTDFDPAAYGRMNKERRAEEMARLFPQPKPEEDDHGDASNTGT